MPMLATFFHLSYSSPKSIVLIYCSSLNIQNIFNILQNIFKIKLIQSRASYPKSFIRSFRNNQDYSRQTSFSFHWKMVTNVRFLCSLPIYRLFFSPPLSAYQFFTDHAFSCNLTPHPRRVNTRSCTSCTGRGHQRSLVSCSQGTWGVGAGSSPHVQDSNMGSEGKAGFPGCGEVSPVLVSQMLFCSPRGCQDPFGA